MNIEIPHQQGDYIPSGTLTKYRIGHYRLDRNGTHLMSYAGQNVDPESPAVWVLPGVIDVNVPIPQMNPNENVIRNNGVFNLVDNDNNPDDIEIEQEINPNIQNRSTLIKKGKTVKSFKLEKQEENEENDSSDGNNKTRSTNISLGQIVVNVPTNLSIQNEKSFTLNDSGTFTVKPDQGYDGIGEVIVNNNALDSNKTFQLKKENANETFTDPNTGQVLLEHIINPSSGNYAMKTVSVSTQTQNKEVFINSEGTITIEPDQGYLGLNQVTINTTVSIII